MSNSQPVTVVVVGAGARGTFAYCTYALARPDDVKIVAVAEPVRERRARFAEMYEIPDDRCFESWQDLLARPKMADGALIATQDQMHVDPTLAALQNGYQVLLEKPMAITPLDCLNLARTSERTGNLLMVCHVLRYQNLFAKVQEIISSGRLGEIIAIEHRENLHFTHMAHSFVRGNWNCQKRSSPMILAKCCHDLDILTWMMAGQRVTRLQSMGSLKHFRSEHAPEGATKRCLDGCPAADDCLYFAPRFYLDMSNKGPLVSTISVDQTYEGRRHALETGPYGLCVYKTDNDVVDHQVVNLEFNGGATATLIMQGFSHEEGRNMRYDGTRATLRATNPFDGQPELKIYDHLNGVVENVHIRPAGPGGHGGADYELMAAFVNALKSGTSEVMSSARTSLESHLLAFAAEEARVSGMTLDMDEFKAALEREHSNAAARTI